MTLPTPRSGTSGTDVPDGVLVSKVAEGDRDALGTLYDRYGRAAFALARQVTGDSANAQEVVGEVFVDLWLHPERYDPARGGSPSWLLASTHHRAVDAVRRARTGRGGGKAPGEPPPPQADRVRRALDALPVEQRQALVLAYYAGRTQREIAEQTAASVGTVQAWMLAGMRQLRLLLDGGAGTGTGATR